jgi:mono/diheme cytochrome c family protein
MLGRGAWIPATLALVVVAAGGCKTEQEVVDLTGGGQAYLAQCAVCHGVEGRGDGPLAATIATAGRTAPAALDMARVRALGRDGVRRAIETGGHAGQAPSMMPVLAPHLGAAWMDKIADYVVAAPSAGKAGRAALDQYLAAPAGADAAGRRTYVMYCSGCHGPAGAGDGFYSPAMEQRLHPAPLRGDALANLDELAITNLISQGGGHAPDAVTMPGWLHAIPVHDRAALAGYVRALAKAAPAGE